MGPRAADIVDGHALDCRFGERSPLARLEEGGARILLLGTDFASCTAFHLAEYRIPGLKADNSFAVMTARGRRWRTVRDTAISDDRFDDLGAAFERDEAVVRGEVGGAVGRLFGLAEAVAYAEEWLAGHRPRAARG